VAKLKKGTKGVKAQRRKGAKEKRGTTAQGRKGAKARIYERAFTVEPLSR
jgi:hypothetical protein